MGKTIGQEADDYQPPKRLTIADLEVVNVNEVMGDNESEDKDGKPFKYKFIIRDSEEYRVPGNVLEQLQEIRKVKPNLKTFKVTKKGEGRQSKYTVIQLD